MDGPLIFPLTLNTLDTSMVRLATSCDISRQPLMLHDLQPAVLCRYLRLTLNGRQGLSATSCRTPVGFFYGHSHLLPNDLAVASHQLQQQQQQRPATSAGDAAPTLSVLSREEIQVGRRFKHPTTPPFRGFFSGFHRILLVFTITRHYCKKQSICSV